MKNIGLLMILVLTGCNHSAILKPEDTKVSRSADMQEEIDYILALDRNVQNRRKNVFRRNKGKLK